MAQDIIQRCNDFYSFDEEDKSPFNLPGWRPFGGSVDWANFSDLCPAPWNYVSQDQLQSSPSWGFFDVYDGGGYVADLGYSITTAAPVISNLRKYGWIDRQTRAVLLEFVIYNANTGYLSISTFLNEILPTGYGNAFAKIDTFPLTSTETGFYQFYLICQLLFIMIVILFVFREMYKIHKMKCSYFRSLWNWVEIVQITFSFLVVIFFVYKSKLVLKSALKVKENPYVPVSFGEAVYWNDAENGLLAMTVFIVTVKLLRMIRFNPHISILLSSLRQSRRLLLSYSVILIIIFLAYALLAMLIMSNDTQRYSSFKNAFVSLLLLCLGAKIEIKDLLHANRILGPVFAFSFIFLNMFIFVNFFVAILNDSLEEVRDNTDMQSEEFEMSDFILERLKELLGCGKHPGDESEEKRSLHSINDNVGNYSGMFERQEPNTKPKISLSTIAFQSHRLRRRARDVQLRNPRMMRKNARKRKNLQSVKFKEEKRAVVEPTAKRRRHHLKLVVSGIRVLDGLNQENMFKRLDLLTSKVIRDDVREEMELLSLLRLLRTSHSQDTEEASSEAMMDDIVISSFITASPSTMTTACTEQTRSSTSGDYSDDTFQLLRTRACANDTRSRTPGYHSLELLRQRASQRGLPQHLRGKQLQDQLRSSVAEKDTQPVKRKASTNSMFKYYSFA